jgi:alkylmercury lyase
MARLSKDELIEEYRQVYAAIPQEAFDLDLRVTVKTIQALSKGKPISPEELARIWEMSLEQVQSILAGAVAAGRVEIDLQGRLVGGVLSLNPTAHRISIDGNHLYAWCAYDAIYTPGVVGKTTLIESTDPVTGELIQVTLTPEGVEDIRPQSAVVSIVGAEADTRGGPKSSRCSQMLFFGSRQSANQWLRGKTDVSILTVEEAFEVAVEFQINPARRIGLVQDDR